MPHRPDAPKPLGLAAALVPVATLVFLLGLSFFLFGDAAAAGPNQIALVFCAIVASFVAWRRGHSVADLRDAAVASVTTGLTAIFILLAVGALIGTWAMSGTLVAMVYYGLQLLNPNYFYMTACLICAVVAVRIGSSWTVAGTIGIGLMGIAAEDGARPGDHRRRDHLGRLFRRQVLAAFGHRQPRLRRRPAPISTTTSASRSGPRCPRFCCRSRSFWSLGSPDRLRPLGRRSPGSTRASTRACCTSCRSSSCSAWRCCAGRRSSPSSSARSPAACSPSQPRPSG